MKGLEYRYPAFYGPEQWFITEEYVSSPPALRIVDEVGAVWTLGPMVNMSLGPNGEFPFIVLRNGMSTGEIASRIERRGRRIRIFTSNGYKHYNGKIFI